MENFRTGYNLGDTRSPVIAPLGCCILGTVSGRLSAGWSFVWPWGLLAWGIDRWASVWVAATRHKLSINQQRIATATAGIVVNQCPVVMRRSPFMIMTTRHFYYNSQ